MQIDLSRKPDVPKHLELFETVVTPPADFGAFWQGVLEELAEVPLQARISPVELRSNSEVKVLEATFSSLGGLEIAAWYSIPAEGKGPFPAVIHFPGYKSEPPLLRNWGRKGVVAISVAVRGKLRSNKVFNPGYPGLLTHGIESQHTYSYKGIIADCVRTVDFLMSRPEVDANRIFIYGSSQGGGLALIAPALRPQVKGAVSGIAFLCCFPESMRLRRTYPYDELTCYAAAHPTRVPQMLETLRYFDAVNFAPLIKCPMAVGIALEDELCPPETTYAAYRRLGCTKELWLYPNSGHFISANYLSDETAWLDRQIALSRETGATP